MRARTTSVRTRLSVTPLEGREVPASVTLNPGSDIQAAINQLQPGDTLSLNGGDYYPPATNAPYQNLLWDPDRGSGHNGTAFSWITIRNTPGQKPVLHLSNPNGGGGLGLINVSYARVEGLEIVGTDDPLTTVGDGLKAENFNENGNNGGSTHDIQFVGNIVHHFGGSGIVSSASQLLIEGNTVYDTSHYSPGPALGRSGINTGFGQLKSTDNSRFGGTLGNPGNVYARIIRNNTVYSNYIITNVAGDEFDGAGIIVDTDGLDRNTNPNPAWGDSRTLVANNVSYSNGAGGLTVFQSSNVDVFNNTLYGNGRTSSDADLINGGSADAPANNSRFSNNIVYPSANSRAGSQQYTSNNSVWSNNLYYNTNGGQVAGTNDKVGNPLFVNLATDGTADFRLKAGSPAIGAANANAPGYDRDGATRLSPSAIGAYEYGLPAGWSNTNIGTPGKTGTATRSGGTWTVTGGGADIWNTSDQFDFASRAYTGDGSIVARVASLTNTNTWAKAGVMFRDGTAAAAFADVVATPGQGVSFQWRSAAGGQPGYAQVTGITAPVWVRLTRTGNSFAGYYSTNGTTWTQVGTAQTVTLPRAARAGLAVTAHDNAQLATATFTDVSIQHSVFTTQTPANPNATDNRTYELGTVFQSSVAGYVTGVRFYRASGETGTNVGRLWDANGNLLATATFTATGSGWVSVTFSQPVFIQAITNYTVSVSFNRYFAVTTGGLATAASNGFLTTVGAGVFGDSGTRPTGTYNNSNYFVDPIFAGL